MRKRRKEKSVKTMSCVLAVCCAGVTVLPQPFSIQQVFAAESVEELSNGNVVTLDSAIADPTQWFLSAGTKEATDGSLTFHSGGYSIYQKQSFTNETVKFNMNASSEGWPSIVFRTQSSMGDPLANGNSCYIIVFYPNSIELQRFNNGTRRVLYGSVPGFDSKFGASGNPFFTHGKENTIELKAEDVENGVHIQLNINGYKMFDCVDDEEECLKGEGYFGTYQSASEITLSNVEESSGSIASKVVAVENFEGMTEGGYANKWAVGGNQSVEIVTANALLGKKSLIFKNNSSATADGANGLYADVIKEFGTYGIVARVKRNDTSGGAFRFVANSTNFAHDSFTEFSTCAPIAYNADGTVNDEVSYNKEWQGYDIPANFDGYLFLPNSENVNISKISLGMAHNSFPANTDNEVMIDSIASYTGEDYTNVIAILEEENSEEPEIPETTYMEPMEDVDFEDSFDDEKYTGYNWEAVSGAINVENGTLKMTNGGFSNAMVSNKIWKDAEFEFDMRVGEGGWAAFQFRKQQPEGDHTSKGYTMYFTAQGGYEILAGDGSGTRSVGGGANATPNADTDFKVKVVTKGKRIQVYVNNMDSPVIDKEDGTYLEGYAGFLKAGGTTYISNFKVKNISENADDIFADDFNLDSLDEKKWSISQHEGTEYLFEEGKLNLNGTEKEICLSANKKYRVYDGEPLSLQYVVENVDKASNAFVTLYQDENNWIKVGQNGSAWYYQLSGTEEVMFDAEDTKSATVNLEYVDNKIDILINGVKAATIENVKLTEEITLQFQGASVDGNNSYHVIYDDIWAKGNGLYADEIPTEEEFQTLVDSLRLQNPEKDQVSLTLPDVPKGYSIAIKSSSNEDLIHLDGTISLPEKEESSSIVLSVTRRWDNQKKDTKAFEIVVPPATSAQDVADEVLKNIQTETYIDQTQYKLPEVPEGFQIKIHSSNNEKIIALDGGMTPPEVEKKVSLTFEIKNLNTGNVYVSKEYQITIAPKTDITELNFFKKLKYGVFVHYVWGGQTSITLKPDGSKVSDPDELVMDAEQFASDCEDMGVQYVILTAWHAGTNPLYPSEVYKQYRTCHSDVPETDILMPILDELNERNIEVFFYTHPADGHDFRQEDKEALGYVMGTGGDYEKWNEYINAQYKELCERYKGKFRGMFIDEGLMDYNNEVFVDYPRLRNTIKSVDSSLVMMQNHYTGKYTCDTAMVENAHMWDADINDLDTWATFQYPTGYTLTNENNWAAIKSPDYTFPEGNTAAVEDMFVYTVMQAASNTEGGGATWAAGPYAGGTKWEQGMLETLKELGSFIKPIEDSIKNTLPSTSYVTTAGTRFPMLEWGVATKSEDNSKEYIHVLKAPKSETLELPAPEDGKVFTSAKLVENGKAVELKQDENGCVTLTLPDGETWDSYDTAIELSVDTQDYLKKLIAKSENMIKDALWQYTTSGVVQFKKVLTSAKAAAEDNEFDHESSIIQLQNAIEVLETNKQYYACTENYALGSTVTASSDMVDNVEWSVNNVVDGDRYCKLPYTNWNYTNKAKGWSSADDLNNPNHTEWIQLELKEKNDVGAIYLYPRNDKDNIGGGFPIDFTIQVSEDGENWITVKDAKGYLRPDGSVQKFIFPTQENTKFVRVTGTKLRSDGDRGKEGSYRMQFAEIEVYGELGNLYTMEPERLIPANVSVTLGEELILPKTVVGVYLDGTQIDLPVTWDEVPNDLLLKEGTFEIKGSVEGSEQQVKCTIQVLKDDDSKEDDKEDNGNSDDQNDNGNSDDQNDNGNSDDQNDSGNSDDQNDNGNSDDQNNNGSSDSQNDNGSSDDQNNNGNSSDNEKQEQVHTGDTSNAILLTMLAAVSAFIIQFIRKKQ